MTQVPITQPRARRQLTRMASPYVQTTPSATQNVPIAGSALGHCDRSGSTLLGGDALVDVESGQAESGQACPSGRSAGLPRSVLMPGLSTEPEWLPDVPEASWSVECCSAPPPAAEPPAQV